MVNFLFHFIVSFLNGKTKQTAKVLPKIIKFFNIKDGTKTAIVLIIKHDKTVRFFNVDCCSLSPM